MNDSDLPERDTIFSQYNIHKSCRGKFNAILINVDTAILAIKNLAQGITTNTVDPIVDEFLIGYEIDSVSKLRSYPRLSWPAIYFKKEWNPIKTIDDFTTVEEIEFGAGNDACFDGDDIEVKRKPGYVEIDFSHGWGDCSSGCIRGKGWVFGVRNNRVKLVKGYKS